MQLIKVVESKLPTIWGKFVMVGFEEITTKINHVALLYGNVINMSKPVLTRIHSECLTGDAFFSLRCDCGFQLKASLKFISKNKSGILLYHRQEGRNIGLLNKIKAYSLQDKGIDTVEANHKLGFSADERDFTICSDMLKLLGIHKINLLTNNPEKIKILNKSGINVIKRIPLIVGRNLNNSNYLDTKALKMGHIF
ncbi:MAG: GTP cyclohydrolase II [Enterobacteriaceae bacterium]